jgi:hypothetical protein
MRMNRLETRRFVLLVVLVVMGTLLGGCGKRPVSPPVELTFLDSGSFDQALSTAMSRGAEVVAVEVFGQVSPNDLPDRLGRWLHAVSSRGGVVRAERDPRLPKERSFGSEAVIQLLVMTYDMVSRELMYASANGYGAVVHVAPEENRVTRILFIRIPDA